jgi:transposase-like protein
MAKEYKNNRSYEKAEKEVLIQRMLEPENISIKQLSIETGISPSTLSTWKTKAIEKKQSQENIGNKPKSAKEKFMVVMQTYTLSEVELASYCQKKGLYVEKVKKWRESCLHANEPGKEVQCVISLKEELHSDKKRIKSLEIELRRKEKALAETAALLVLRKKLDAILGDGEED